MTLDKVAGKTHEQLVRDEIIREALELAARELERLSGSSTYEKAWKKGAKFIRGLKP